MVDTNFCSRDNEHEVRAATLTLLLEEQTRRHTAYLDLGQYQPALNDYSEAIRVSPRDGEVYAARAFCYALLGRNGEAQQDVEWAAELGFDRAFLERALEEVKRQPQLLRGQ